jgi:hypothetical protein
VFLSCFHPLKFKEKIWLFIINPNLDNGIFLMQFIFQNIYFFNVPPQS